MKIEFSILALCFLTGCPQVENPSAPPHGVEKPEEQKAEDKPNKYHQEESIDPFDLKVLLRQPIGDLPEGIPEDYREIDPKSLADNFVSLESLEGTWYGAPFAETSPAKDLRVYLQLRSDQSFSYGCVRNHISYAQAWLITGKYSIQDGNLRLQTKSYKKYLNEILGEDFSEVQLYGFIFLCGDNSWQSGFELTIPARQLDSNSLVLFDKDFPKARVFLIRK